MAMFDFYEKKDAQLQTDVKNELKSDPSVTSDHISVTASDGIVTLRGSVPHYFEKSTAEEAAQRVTGVRAVADEMEVDLMGSYERTDEDIAKAAVHALEWSYVGLSEIKVSVEKGWVTLKGEAQWDFERTAVQAAIGQLMGVRGVSNQVTLKTNVQPTDVKARIESSLKRTALEEGRRISVEVDGGRVTLTGCVHSYSEIGDAGLAAWNVPGVLSVRNNLKLSH
jgi:osmotically-inducible protein OsmY